MCTRQWSLHMLCVHELYIRCQRDTAAAPTGRRWTGVLQIKIKSKFSQQSFRIEQSEIAFGKSQVFGIR